MADQETARENAIVMVFSITPDACYLPGGSVAAFSIVANGTTAVNTCEDVRATSNHIMNMTSLFSTCQNDQPGVAGVASGTIGGICEPIENQCRVRAKGKHILRDGDIVWMNNRNCLGIVKILFPKKSVILSRPGGVLEQNALKHFKGLNPGVDVIDPSAVNGPLDLSQYEQVIIQGHGGTFGPGAGSLAGTPAISGLSGSGGLSPEKLADFLNSSGFHGSSVELVGCNTATSFNGNKPFAQQLSELLGIPVTGYPHEITIKPGGIVRGSGSGSTWSKKIVTQFKYEFGFGEPEPKTFPGK